MVAKTEYKPLPIGRLSGEAGYCRPSYFAPQPVTADSPALEVMTDFKLVAAATIDSETHVDVANHAMIARGVRSLLVVDASGMVVGVVTAADILGERPMQVVLNRGVRHQDLRVCDIMTSQSQIEVLQMRDVLKSEVGNIVETLKCSGRQHALVVESDVVSDRQLVRGIFSASQVARQLGVPFHAQEVASTFAQIETAMMGGVIC